MILANYEKRVFLNYFGVIWDILDTPKNHMNLEEISSSYYRHWHWYAATVVALIFLGFSTVFLTWKNSIVIFAQH